MSNRSRWQSDESFEIPQTPLIDIIFILIVFFLVATTFYSEERDVDIKLPEGSEGTAIAADDGRIVVNIRKGGVIVVDNKIHSMDDLAQRFADAADGEASAIVEIRGDSQAQHGQVMAVINLCKKHGIADMALSQLIVQDDP